MDADRVAEVRAWLQEGRQGEYAWMRADDVDELLEAAEWPQAPWPQAPERWARMSEQERGLIAVALAMLSIDMADGTFTGAPATPQALARELPIVVRLIDELARSTGLGGIDAGLRGALSAVLDQRAAEAG